MERKKWKMKQKWDRKEGIEKNIVNDYDKSTSDTYI